MSSNLFHRSRHHPRISDWLLNVPAAAEVRSVSSQGSVGGSSLGKSAQSPAQVSIQPLPTLIWALDLDDALPLLMLLKYWRLDFFCMWKCDQSVSFDKFLLRASKWNNNNSRWWWWYKKIWKREKRRNNVGPCAYFSRKSLLFPANIIGTLGKCFLLLPDAFAHFVSRIYKKKERKKEEVEQIDENKKHTRDGMVNICLGWCMEGACRFEVFVVLLFCLALGYLLAHAAG